MECGTKSALAIAQRERLLMAGESRGTNGDSWPFSADHAMGRRSFIPK
jgi:hypothetical protein